MLAILIIFASTSAGSLVLGQFGIRANAAELSSENTASGKSGNVLTAFLSRSPGERGATDAIKGKAKANGIPINKVADVAPRTQRALGKVFNAPGSNAAGTTIPQPVLAFMPDNLVAEPGAAVSSALPVLGGGSSLFSPVIGGGIGGSGGFIGGGAGGGGGGGPIINTPPTPTIASAVPEPSTWIFLLFGFAAIGASLRVSKSRNMVMAGRVGSCAPN